MKNTTPLRWLEQHHPETYAQFLEFQKDWQSSKRKQWYKKTYKPTGNRRGRPKKV